MSMLLGPSTSLYSTKPYQSSSYMRAYLEISSLCLKQNICCGTQKNGLSEQHDAFEF